MGVGVWVGVGVGGGCVEVAVEVGISVCVGVSSTMTNETFGCVGSGISDFASEREVGFCVAEQHEIIKQPTTHDMISCHVRNLRIKTFQASKCLPKYLLIILISSGVFSNHIMGHIIAC